jgi:benzoyl-CoA reductase/2-hydroxyglutaryl-CoA dehydratase subunit BcrC/BadD/HgdB
VQELGEIPADAPDGGLVKPDMLIAPSNSCDNRIKHYQNLSRYWDIPVYGYDAMFPQYEATPEEIDNCMKYNAEEYKGLIAFLEKQTGKKMDWDKFEEFLHRDRETRLLYREIYEMRQAVPCPMLTRDAVTAMVPWYWFPCDAAAVEFYRKLRQEVKERVDHKIGSLPEEKYRICWLGLPPWHTLTLYNYLDEYNAASVIETIYHPCPVPEDRDDPLETLAYRMYYTHWTDESGMFFPLDWMRSVVEKYKIDGIVVHQVLGCRQVTVGAKTCIQQLQQEYRKMPVLFIPGDNVDLRDYSDAETRANLASFMEAVATYKERGNS